MVSLVSLSSSWCMVQIVNIGTNKNKFTLLKLFILHQIFLTNLLRKLIINYIFLLFFLKILNDR